MAGAVTPLPYLGLVPLDVVATIAWDSGVAFLTTDQPRLRFGRSSQCDVRVGHQPLADRSVPRVAGAVAVLDGRIAVDNLSDRVAFDLKTADGPLEAVRPGALLAPAADLHIYLRRATVNRATHGTPEDHADRVAASKLGASA